VKCVAPEDRERVAGFIRSGRPEPYEHLALRKDGSMFPVYVRARMAQVGGRKVRISAVRDLTEQRRAERERSQMTDILAASLNEIYLFDARTLRFIYANQGALRNLGYTFDEMLRMTPLDIKPEHTVASFQALVEPLRRREKPLVVFETVHRRANGGLYPVEVHLQLFEQEAGPVFLAIILDITERKRTEEALRVSEERLRLALEGTTDGIWDWNFKSGKVYFSPRYYTMLGYESGEFPASYESWRDLLHPDDAPGSEQAVRRALEEGSAFATEFRMRAKSGDWVWIMGRGKVAERDSEGRPVRMAGSHSDITARKQVEEALSRLSRQDQEALRVARMGHWVFDVASGKFIFNDQYYSLHGTTAEEAGGYEMTAEEFARRYVHPEYTYQVETAVRSAIETTEPDFQFQVEGCILRADGEPRFVTVWFRIEKDSRGRTIRLYGVNQDITDRKRPRSR